MKKQLLLTLAAACLFSSPVLAASSAEISGGSLGLFTGRDASSNAIGYDVSYPECRTTLPAVRQFTIVGVNGGLARTQNPCLSTELTWAETATGKVAQPPVALYVNTGNPGDVTPAVADWPTSGMSPLYGACNGTDSIACAYIYGRRRAAQDVAWAQAANMRVPGSHWWLDVETTNSWSDNQAANAADLEAMTATIRRAGGIVGVYSAGDQWGQIVGNYDGAARYLNLGMLNGLSDWVAGATSLEQAQAMCTNFTPFTSGGYASMTQYVPDGATIDSDYSCRR